MHSSAQLLAGLGSGQGQGPIAGIGPLTPTGLTQQLLTYMAFKENNMSVIIFGMILLFVLDALFKLLPILIQGWKHRAEKYWEKHGDRFTSILPEKQSEHSIEFVRTYVDNGASVQPTQSSRSTSPMIAQQDTDEMVDSIIDTICNHETVETLLYQKRFYIYSKNPIPLTTHIMAQLMSIDESQGSISGIRFRLYSNTVGIREIRAWINQVHRNYVVDKANRIGTNRYYFQEFVVEPMMEVDGSYRWDSAPKTLHFTMTEFQTSKNLQNVYGDHIKELKDRVNLFVNHPEWYEARGIPYTLGIMGYGDPGCGKTSIAKALAKSLDTHIINISLRPTTTQRQLMNLFYDERIYILDSDGQRQMLTIPLTKRFYIIEDIDCLTDIVLDREYRREDAVVSDEPVDHKKQKLSLAASANNQITLSFLLNLLDGVLETPGRILMITTNYPEKLDRALIRPGRIDVKVHFTRCTGKMIAEIMANFYSMSYEDIYERIGEQLTGLWTPAEVIAIFSQYYNDSEAAQRALYDHPLLISSLSN